MIARLGLVMVLALAFSVVEADNATAQCGVRGIGGMGYGAYGFDAGRLYGVLSQNVPYYAAFPPVYYSAPVPRTYGYSPFAYPPGTATPEIEVPTVAAKVIMNPYVPASTATENKTAKKEENNVTQRASVVAPLAIVNPFVGPQVAKTTGPLLQAVALNR